MNESHTHIDTDLIKKLLSGVGIQETMLEFWAVGVLGSFYGKVL